MRGVRSSANCGYGRYRSAFRAGRLPELPKLGVATQTAAGGGVIFMTATTTPVLDQAIELDRLGYWVVGIRAPGESLGPDRTAKGKEPAGGKGWGLERWTEGKLRRELSAHPNRGIGVCFGPGRAPDGGWLVDLEGDGERAANSLSIVLGLAVGEEPITPAWDSRRGGHTIFATSEANGLRLLDLLSQAGATEGKGDGKAGVWKLAELPDLEWRIGGYKSEGIVKQVQSVIPPTPGEDGIPRVWRTAPDTRVAELPDSVFAVLEVLAERVAIKAEANGHLSNGNGPLPFGALVQPAKSGPSIEQRAILYLGKCNPAVSGNNGHDTTFGVACRVGPGFNLTEQEAFRLLWDHYNPRCEPPWSEGDLRHKVEDAYAKETRRGWLLEGKPDRGKAGGAQPSANGPGPATSANGDDHSIDADLAWFPQTDTGNAERMIRRHGQNIRHCHPWKKSLVWDGRRWAPDDIAAVRRMAKATARKILAEASTVEDEEHKEGLIKWARSTESAKNLNSMIACASSEDGVPVLPRDLNTDPWLLNVQNGTLDLRTGKLRDHRREDLITALAPVDFHQDARCPLWDATLDRFFAKDQELIAFWDRLCGIALTGDVSSQILPILYGLGDNGKSTMTGAMLGLLGPDYAAIAPQNMLLLRRGEHHPTELAYLFAKRLVVAMETEEGARLNEPLIKQLTGSDPITARGMRQDNFTFDPTHKLWLCTNHKPVIKGTDHAIWRRPKLVPFEIAIPEAEKIANFPALLRAEYPGILARAVRGCLDWQKNRLGVPKAVSEATDKYRAEQDTIRDFIAEEMTVEASLQAKAGPTYQRYRRFTQHLGEEPISLTKFGLAMAERGFQKKENHGIWYLGIGLRPDFTSVAGD
jgi:P4 family phage/plasmid primase-like protien